MAMAIDNRQQSQLTGMAYDPMRYQAPQFTNPWASGTPSTQLYQNPLTSTAGEQHAHVHSQQSQVSRPTQVSIPPYVGLAVTSSPLGAGIDLSVGTLETQGLQDISQDHLASRPFASGFVTSAPQSTTYAPTSAPQYAMDYSNHTRGAYGFQDPSRRESHPHPLSTQAQRDSFSEAVDASRGMLSLSQSDITPRNIYGGGSRTSTDSYGFPTTHSAHSSISSASTYPSYYSGSVAESVTDYSSASESVGDMNSRTLPRPSALVGASLPPAPQSMMGQFSSKVSSSSQKKHKCKICDKRFTRPSSLQTHMYSHTGEKPFACEVEGCGRHFSVVSNLRRHRKVHKGERGDHPSPDED